MTQFSSAIIGGLSISFTITFAGKQDLGSLWVLPSPALVIFYSHKYVFKIWHLLLQSSLYRKGCGENVARK